MARKIQGLNRPVGEFDKGIERRPLARAYYRTQAEARRRRLNVSVLQVQAAQADPNEDAGRADHD